MSPQLEGNVRHERSATMTGPSAPSFIIMPNRHITSALILESLSAIVTETSKIQMTVSEISPRSVDDGHLSQLTRTVALIRLQAQDAIDLLSEVRLEEPRN